MEKTTAFIGLGSNLGDGKKILKAAWSRLGRSEEVRLCFLSHPYLTAPVDMESSNWFTNAVGMVETTLNVYDLLHNLMEIESEFGRKRDASTTGYQDRSLDLDLLCYGETALDTPELVLPHPRMTKRLFVMAPFAEIAPSRRVSAGSPTMGEQCAQLLEDMKAGKCPSQELKKGQWED